VIHTRQTSFVVFGNGSVSWIFVADLLSPNEMMMARISSRTKIKKDNKR
jgi:hypothetical protein